MDFDFYQDAAAGTDQFAGQNAKKDEGLMIPLLGIAGETGTLLAEFKKKVRDKDSYEGFQEKAEEELGDILWYLSNIASRLGLSLSEIASKNLQKTNERWPIAGDDPEMFLFFDEAFPPKERLPRALKVRVFEIEKGKRAHMEIHPDGIPLGDPLTDNAYDGQRAMIHRSFANQRSDYQFVAEEWRRLTQIRRRTSGATRSDVMVIARYLLASCGAVTYFGLHKLAYLTEYLHVRKSGRRLTSAYFIRQKDGPYCTDLEIDRLRRADGSIRVFKEGSKLSLRLGTDKTPQLFSGQPEISDDAKAAADEALQRYGDKNDSELKTAVYLTAPMRFLLRREQSEKSNYYNAPIDFLAAR